MLKLSILPCAALFFVSICALAGDLPKRSIQVINSADSRTKAYLKQGDRLLVEISNVAGNATGMTIDVGKSGLKLIESGIRQDTTDDGGAVVGSQNVILLFEATKAASGKLKVSLDQTFAKTDPFQLDIVVKSPVGANAN